MYIRTHHHPTPAFGQLLNIYQYTTGEGVSQGRRLGQGWVFQIKELRSELSKLPNMKQHFDACHPEGMYGKTLLAKEAGRMVTMRN